MHVDDIVAYHTRCRWKAPLIEGLCAARVHHSGLVNYLQYIELMVPYATNEWLVDQLRQQRLPCSNREYCTLHWTSHCTPREALQQLHTQYTMYRRGEVLGISLPNFRRAFHGVLTDDEAATMFTGMDLNRDGFVSFYEYAKGMWGQYGDAPFPSKEQEVPI